ncbi:MAG: EFR1 family ferrodoxin [Sphaerochaeta sp.]|nr:EFR1 family ferrodoxin [Sphaerochaeta sp.]
MVIYFSGTGNSRFGARIIAQTLGDELCSLTDMLRDKTKGLHSEKPWVFITPTYAWRMPRFVDAWIRRTTFTGSTKAYFRHDRRRWCWLRRKVAPASLQGKRMGIQRPWRRPHG